MRSLLLQNVNGLVFVVGFVAFVGGVAAWSVPLAAVVAGGVLMAGAAFPYLRRVWKG